MSVMRTRREVVASSLVAGSLLALSGHRVAVSTYQAELSSLDLPKLDIMVTPETFASSSTSIAAGRYLLTVTGPADAEWSSAVGLLRPPSDTTIEEVMLILGDIDPSAPLPEVTYRTSFSGGAVAAPGTTASVVIDLTPGVWLVWGNDVAAPQLPIPITVTSEYPATVPEPAADVTLSLTDFAITVAGNLAAGDHILAVTSAGEPHSLAIRPVPAGTTNADVAVLVGSMRSSTPVATSPLNLDPAETSFIPVQSDGVTTWREVTLQSGTYAAICWFLTEGSTIPHASFGMHTVFEVN